MQRSITKKLLASLMIIMILATDFFVLGSNLISYATDKADIEFSAYFEDEKTEISPSIKSDNLSLFVKVKVNGDGYLDGGKINISNSNFNIKQEILPSNTYIENIEGNTVNLKQINEGEVAVIELKVEPKISEKININMLSQKSTVKLTGTYMEETYEGIDINEETSVTVNYQVDETAETELITDIITNKIVSINGVNKRVVQLLVKSRLTENQYPVQQSKLNISIPKLGEQTPEISILTLGKLATNGKTEITSQEWSTDGEKIEIAIKNDKDANNNINWSKNIYDELIITYLYPENVDATKVEISTNSELILHNSKNTYTGTYTKGIENKEPNNIIMGKTEIVTDELYKGKLYANLDEIYNTKSTLVVTNKEVVDEVVLFEGPDVLSTGESELATNTKYISTEFNLNKMLSILGQEGTITIKNGDEKILVNKETKTNEAGNVIINYEKAATQLEITTSEPANIGILEFYHTKMVTGNNFSREQIQNITHIKTKNNLLGTVTAEEQIQNIVENNTEKYFELKETVSKATLTIENDKETLSAIEPNELTLGMTIVTDGSQYNLSKNPEITLQLPSNIENVELGKIDKQHADEFEVSVPEYNPTDKTIKIKLTGEQTSYPESALTQPYLQLNLKVTVSQLATTHMDQIIMTYTNNNTSETGIVEKAVQIEAKPGLLKMFNLSLNENISTTQTIKQQITEKDLGKTVQFETILVNNTGSNMSNVRILGKLPTTLNNIEGQDANTLETTLKNVTAPNATIYYTQNPDATEDTENEANGWTTDLATLTNAKKYLIKLDTLNEEKYIATIEVQLPKTLDEDKEAYTQYEVIYDTNISTNKRETSRIIGLVTYVVSDLELELTAKLGNETLKNYDKVKEGEVIRYTVKVTNKSKETITNANLQLNIPEGTVFVKPIEGTYTLEDGEIVDNGYVYAENAYYEEITDSEKLKEVTSIIISELLAGEENAKQYEYEVRVKTDNQTGNEILNRVYATYNNIETKSPELKNIVEEANVRVTVKRTIDKSVQLYAGGTTRYMVYVENLSDKTINNLEMQIISDTFKVQKIENERISIYSEIPEKIAIKEIKANDLVYFSIYGSIDEYAKEINTSIVVYDENEEKYRSNALKEILPHTDVTINITSPQNNQYIKQDDIVEYNIIVTNTGDIEGQIVVEDTISEFLTVQSITVNKSTVKQITNELEPETFVDKISNNIYQLVVLKPFEVAEINIKAKVGYIPELHHNKVITNSATARVFTVLEDNSEIITHILQSNSVQEENTGNIINGFAWLDENANGRKDEKEQVLSGIGVKLFDLSTSRYLVESETKTDYKGQYTLTNIKDGSYLIVFEYDRTKYELTTAFAQGVDTSINSKVVIRNTDAVIEITDLTENKLYMNIGLKEGSGNLIEKPEQPENPEDPTDPEQPENPENPTNPEEPEKPENPQQPEEQKYKLSGLAWLDKNRNGQKEDDEIILEGIKAKLYDVSSKNYLKDNNGKTIETRTDAKGSYTFENLEKGEYIVIFEYDIEEYEPTIYLAEGVDTTKNSKVVIKKVNINGEEKTVAVTDRIDVQKNITNINIGLKEKLIFDLELNKYISRIVVQTSKSTKAYDYENDTFAKVEIQRKQIKGALVVLEYTIKVKNNGEMAGYVQNIVDYLPSGLTFSSELNSEWYLSGTHLYTKSLENVELAPGEEKEVKLILTKTMADDNIGLINNRAEIYQDYNKYGDADIDSTPNNQMNNEDDYGSVDVIIGVATGGSANMSYIILLMINAVLIGIAIKLMIKNKIIKLPKRKGRR